MAGISLILAVLAVGLLADFAIRRPWHFPVAMLAMGVFRFGADAGGGMNLSALWLLAVFGLALLAIARLPRPRVSLSVPEKAYALFLAWCLLLLLRSPNLAYGVRMLLKLAFPFFAMMVARRATLTGKALPARRALAWVLGASFAAFALVGGPTQKYLGVVCWKASSILWAAAAFADHLAVMGVVALVCWRVWGGRHYLAYGILAGISPVLIGIRTGLGGFTLGMATFLLLSCRRTVAAPLLCGLVLLAAGAILFVPSMKEHAFHNAESVDSGAAIWNPLAVSMDNVNMSGRTMMWDMAMRRLWDDQPLWGSGLGAAQAFMYTQNVTRIKVVHSSYVEVLCDMGLIGLGFYVAAFFACMSAAVRVYRQAATPDLRAISLATACSIPAIMFCMGFDNVINYTLVAGQIPFALTGFTVALAEQAGSSQPLQPRICNRALVSAPRSESSR